MLWPRSWIAQGMSIVSAGFLLSDHRWHHPVVRTQLQIHPEPGSTMHRLCEDGDIVFTIIFTLEVQKDIETPKRERERESVGRAIEARDER